MAWFLTIELMDVIYSSEPVMKAVNGFSNMFWGWGGEDDDMANRLRVKKLFISRYPANIAR